MFGKRTRATARPTEPSTGNRLAARRGELIEDTFPWEDDLEVAAAEARNERRQGQLSPSVMLEPNMIIESLAVFGVQVLQLAD